MPVENAVEEVNRTMVDYKFHCVVKDQQSKLFRQCKNNISEEQAMVQAVTQYKVQSAHWNDCHITTFTAVAWLENGSKSFAVVFLSLRLVRPLQRLLLP